MRPLLRGLRGELKSTLASAGVVQRKGVDIISPSIRGRPYRASWDVQRAVRDGMTRITWVFRCIHVRAAKSAGLPIVVRRGDPEDGELIENHELVNLLNGYPAPVDERESAYAFRYRLSAIMDLNPQGAFIEVERKQTRLGGVTALRLLPVGYTHPIPGKSGKFLDGFRVHVPGLNPVDLPPENVVWVKHPHPLDPYDGLNPMQAAGIAIDTEWLAKTYQRNFLRNDGRGGGFLIVAGDIDPDDLDELQAQVDAASGPGGAGRITVLEGTQQDTGGEPTGNVGGVHYVDTSVTPREASYIEMRKYTKEEIHGAWGVPTSIGAADSSNRTYENADADYFMFWNDTMIDHCRMLDRPFDLIDGDPDTFVAHNFDSVAVLQREKIAQKKLRLEELKAGAITWDEYREDDGRDPYAVGGNVVLQPISFFPVASTDEDGIEEEPEPEPAPAPAPTEPTEPQLVAATRKSGELEEVVSFGKFIVPAKALRNRRKERLRRIKRYEKRMKSVLVSFFNRQERAVLEKLRGPKSRQGTRHWRKADEPAMAGVTGGSIDLKVIDADDVFDPRRWDTPLRDDLITVLAGVIEDFGDDAFTRANDSKRLPEVEEKQDDDEFDPGTPRLLEYIRARGNKIVGANDTTYDAIARALAEGEEAGETIDELAKRVEGVFDEARGFRAETIARTEVISAANMGSLEGAAQSGVVENKGWLATEDDRTRDTHVEADGQFVPLDEPFEVGDDELMFPGDPEGSPEETINCRCTLIYETEGEPLL